MLLSARPVLSSVSNMKTFVLILISLPLYLISDKVFGFGFYTSLAIVTLALLIGQFLAPRLKSMI